MGSGRVGEYRLQAAIAALHDRAPNAAQTDWPQIAGRTGLLEQVTGSPVVTLNRAVAVAMADGPEAGLALLDRMEPPGASIVLDAVRAHLLQMAVTRRARSRTSAPLRPERRACPSSGTSCGRLCA